MKVLQMIDVQLAQESMFVNRQKGGIDFCGHDVPFNRVKREELLVTGRPAKRFEEENKKEDVL